MAKYWIYEGTPVKCSDTGKKLVKFVADNELLEGYSCTKGAYDSAVQEEAEKASERALKGAKRELLIDAIHALLMQANHDRLQGKELVQPMDDILGQWLKL